MLFCPRSWKDASYVSRISSLTTAKSLLLATCVYMCVCVCVCVCVSALDVKVRNGGVGSDVSHDRERKMN